MIDLQQFEQAGFAITSPLLGTDNLHQLIHLVELQDQSDTKRGGIRDVIDRIPDLYAVAVHQQVRTLVEQILGPDAFVVRATLFDKTPESNWKVPWHQDVTIAARERLDVDGYGPWSIKEGVPHVQPPSEILRKMISVRVHLDPCPEANGALRVMPGTHRLGKLNQNAVDVHIQEESVVCCEADAGAVLVMRPLLLHASSAAASPAHRRVLHFDFAIGELAGGLQWKMRDIVSAEV